METIAIEFPARRYHATPWDAHVNEGRIEWPPSPWRLLRALLAVGYNKLGWLDGPDEVSESALAKLRGVMPSYSLPLATDAHTRHYMPTRDKTAKVFDAFLRFASSDARLLIQFDVELTPDERAALGKLVSGLTYLGRAESWAEASLLPAGAELENTEESHLCQPYDSTAADAIAEGSRVRLLAALPSDRFDRWRAEQIELAANALEAEERLKQEKKGGEPSATVIKKVRAKAAARFPSDMVTALQAETATWQGQGWPQPPGSQWVDYHLPGGAIQRQPLTPLAGNSTVANAPAVLLAIDGDGKRGTVRPLMIRALPLLEVLHAESVRKSVDELGFGNIPQLTGKADDGSVLRGHTHAHWLPLSLFGHERIDHVLVHCRSGFTAQAISALAAIRWAYSKGIDRLSINLAGMGTVAEIASQLRRTPSCRPNGFRSLIPSTRWDSTTPLVLRKFAHRHGKKTPEGQVREELVQRGFDEPLSVRFWSSEEMVRKGLKGFVLRRKPGKPQPPMERSFAATLEFSQPQVGPIQLGYASHFGLGLFASSDTSNS